MFFSAFLKSRKPYMLFMLPVLAAGALVSAYFFRPGMSAVVLPGGMPGIGSGEMLSVMESRCLGFGMMLAVAYSLFYINILYKFLPQSTTLPSVLYLLLTTGLVLYEGFQPVQVAVLAFALALAALQGAINHPKSNSYVYNFGFLCLVGVLIYPKLAVLLLWAFCVLFFSGRSTLKDMSALLLGVATPVLFVFFGYFWTGRWTEAVHLFAENVGAGSYAVQAGGPLLAAYGILAVLLLLALYHIMVFYPVSVVNQRRGILSFLSMLFFCGVSLLVVPGIYPDILYLLFLPLSYVYSQYLLIQRLRWLDDVVFLSLLGVAFILSMPDAF